MVGMSVIWSFSRQSLRSSGLGELILKMASVMVVNNLAVYNSDAFWSFPYNLSPLRATKID